MRSAYLIAHVDTQTTPPTIIGVGIYSEDAGSLTVDLKRSFPLDVLEVKGEDYSEAVKNLRQQLAASKVYDWVKPLLSAE